MCESPAESGFYYLKSRYYDPQICRFINADGLASTGQGFLGCNMFAYCLNNPVNGGDCSGNLPVVFTQEQLEQLGEWVETVFGLLRYITKPNSKGELYEYWFDENDNIVHSRHHSNHGNEKQHSVVPHDHDWHDDGKGGRKQDSTSTSPDLRYHGPNREKDNQAEEIATGVVAGIILYEGVKWIVAIVFAPETLGGSIAVAGVMP